MALSIAGGLAAINQFLMDGLHSFALHGIVIPSPRRLTGSISCSWAIDGRTAPLLGLGPIFMAAGALTGMGVSASMMLGGTLCWAVFVPVLQHQGVFGNGLSRLVKWTLWGGVSCMVTSGLLSFALQWQSALRAFTNLVPLPVHDFRAMAQVLSLLAFAASSL